MRNELYIFPQCVEVTDYTLVSLLPVTFTSTTTLCLTFDFNDDDILETDESFSVDITDFGGAAAGTPTGATVTIEDNDGEY